MGDALTLTYMNSKGNVVPVKVTDHALHRLRQRWESYYMKECPGTSHLKMWLAEMFTKAKVSKVDVNKSKKMKKRAKRHSNNTVYFTASPFTFIVENCALVTVEISEKGSRHLNDAHALGY